MQLVSYLVFGIHWVHLALRSGVGRDDDDIDVTKSVTRIFEAGQNTEVAMWITCYEGKVLAAQLGQSACTCSVETHTS